MAMCLLTDSQIIRNHETTRTSALLRHTCLERSFCRHSESEILNERMLMINSYYKQGLLGIPVYDRNTLPTRKQPRKAILSVGFRAPAQKRIGACVYTLNNTDGLDMGCEQDVTLDQGFSLSLSSAQMNITNVTSQFYFQRFQT